ncbi:Folylpolyglutamate synthetase [Xylographa bjoerkii]|nr:Folylpolyglutamate synthetase [Xylographa bjoerkii]
MGNNTVLLQHIYRIGLKKDVNQFRRVLKNSSMSLLTTLLVRCRGGEWDTIAKLSTDQKIDRILPSEVRCDASTPPYWSPRKAETEKDIKRIASDINNQSTLKFRAISFQALLNFVLENQFGEPVSDFLVWHDMLQIQLSQYLRLHRHDQVQIFRYTQIANELYDKNPFAHDAVLQSLQQLQDYHWTSCPVLARTTLELITKPLKEFLERKHNDLKAFLICLFILEDRFQRSFPHEGVVKWTRQFHTDLDFIDDFTAAETAQDLADNLTRRDQIAFQQLRPWNIVDFVESLRQRQRDVREGVRVCVSLEACFKYRLVRTAESALKCLNRLQTGYAKLEENRHTGRKSDKSGVMEMKKWLEIIGYSVGDLRRLKIIHVAGTKGKGTTCTYVASILKECGIPKVGLYTSPHLKNVRERIQIDGMPISEEAFARSFFKIWDKIAPGDRLDHNNRPGYFRYLTLMSFDVYLEEGVNVAVYETGVGGEYDSTNVIEEPIATGITGLGIDHEKTLQLASDLRPSYFKFTEGDSAKKEQIAWHKSGIFKAGRPAFSVPQGPEAEHILRCRAEEKGVLLTFVDSGLEFSDLDFPSTVHKENATLAVNLANTFLCKYAEILAVQSNRLSKEALRGLKHVRLAGRCQIIKEWPMEWYLDGAHTEDSLNIVGQWFSKTVTR